MTIRVSEEVQAGRADLDEIAALLNRIGFAGHDATVCLVNCEEIQVHGRLTLEDLKRIVAVLDKFKATERWKGRVEDYDEIVTRWLKNEVMEELGDSREIIETAWGYQVTVHVHRSPG